MDNVELSKWFGLTIMLMLQHKGSCCLFAPVLLCDESNVKIKCSNKTFITNLNITLPTPTTNVCTTYKTDNILYNETDVNRCIGKRSCMVSSTDIDFADLPEQTWKLNVKYSCYKPGKTKLKGPKIFCPDEIKSFVRCNPNRKINIESAHLDTSNSSCLAREECASIIENGTKTLCDRNNPCDIIQGEAFKIDWNSCTRSPKYVFVSYVCSADFANNKTKDDSFNLTELLGIVIGVICGLMVVGVIGGFYIFHIKRSKAKLNHFQCCKHSTATNDMQDNYTSLHHIRDVSNYTILNNVTPISNITNDHNYIDIL